MTEISSKFTENTVGYGKANRSDSIKADRKDPSETNVVVESSAGEHYQIYSDGMENEYDNIHKWYYIDRIMTRHFREKNRQSWILSNGLI